MKIFLKKIISILLILSMQFQMIIATDSGVQRFTLPADVGRSSAIYINPNGVLKPAPGQTDWPNITLNGGTLECTETQINSFITNLIKALNNEITGYFDFSGGTLKLIPDADRSAISLTDGLFLLNAKVFYINADVSADSTSFNRQLNLRTVYLDLPEITFLNTIDKFLAKFYIKIMSGSTLIIAGNLNAINNQSTVEFQDNTGLNLSADWVVNGTLKMPKTTKLTASNEKKVILKSGAVFETNVQSMDNVPIEQLSFEEGAIFATSGDFADTPDNVGRIPTGIWRSGSKIDDSTIYPDDPGQTARFLPAAVQKIIVSQGAHLFASKTKRFVLNDNVTLTVDGKFVVMPNAILQIFGLATIENPQNIEIKKEGILKLNTPSMALLQSIALADGAVINSQVAVSDDPSGVGAIPDKILTWAIQTSLIQSLSSLSPLRTKTLLIQIANQAKINLSTFRNLGAKFYFEVASGASFAIETPEIVVVQDGGSGGDYPVLVVDSGGLVEFETGTLEESGIKLDYLDAGSILRSRGVIVDSAEGLSKITGDYIWRAACEQDTSLLLTLEDLIQELYRLRTREMTYQEFSILLLKKNRDDLSDFIHYTINSVPNFPWPHDSMLNVFLKESGTLSNLALYQTARNLSPNLKRVEVDFASAIIVDAAHAFNLFSGQTLFLNGFLFCLEGAQLFIDRDARIEYVQNGEYRFKIHGNVDITTNANLFSDNGIRYQWFIDFTTKKNKSKLTLQSFFLDNAAWQNISPFIELHFNCPNIYTDETNLTYLTSANTTHLKKRVIEGESYLYADATHPLTVASDNTLTLLRNSELHALEGGKIFFAQNAIINKADTAYIVINEGGVLIDDTPRLDKISLCDILLQPGSFFKTVSLLKDFSYVLRKVSFQNTWIIALNNTKENGLYYQTISNSEHNVQLSEDVKVYVTPDSPYALLSGKTLTLKSRSSLNVNEQSVLHIGDNATIQNDGGLINVDGTVRTTRLFDRSSLTINSFNVLFDPQYSKYSGTDFAYDKVYSAEKTPISALLAKLKFSTSAWFVTEDVFYYLDFLTSQNTTHFPKQWLIRCSNDFEERYSGDPITLFFHPDLPFFPRTNTKDVQYGDFFHSMNESMHIVVDKDAKLFSRMLMHSKNSTENGLKYTADVPEDRRIQMKANQILDVYGTLDYEYYNNTDILRRVSNFSFAAINIYGLLRLGKKSTVTADPINATSLVQLADLKSGSFVETTCAITFALIALFSSDINWIVAASDQKLGSSFNPGQTTAPSLTADTISVNIYVKDTLDCKRWTNFLKSGQRFVVENNGKLQLDTNYYSVYTDTNENLQHNTNSSFVGLCFKNGASLVISEHAMIEYTNFAHDQIKILTGGKLEIYKKSFKKYTHAMDAVGSESYSGIDLGISEKFLKDGSILFTHKPFLDAPALDDDDETRGTGYIPQNITWWIAAIQTIECLTSNPSIVVKDGGRLTLPMKNSQYGLSDTFNFLNNLTVEDGATLVIPAQFTKFTNSTKLVLKNNATLELYSREQLSLLNRISTGAKIKLKTNFILPSSTDMSKIDTWYINASREHFINMRGQDFDGISTLPSNIVVESLLFGTEGRTYTFNNKVIDIKDGAFLFNPEGCRFNFTQNSILSIAMSAQIVNFGLIVLGNSATLLLSGNKNAVLSAFTFESGAIIQLQDVFSDSSDAGALGTLPAGCVLNVGSQISDELYGQTLTNLPIGISEINVISGGYIFAKKHNPLKLRNGQRLTLKKGSFLSTIRFESPDSIYSSVAVENGATLKLEAGSNVKLEDDALIDVQSGGMLDMDISYKSNGSIDQSPQITGDVLSFKRGSIIRTNAKKYSDLPHYLFYDITPGVAFEITNPSFDFSNPSLSLPAEITQLNIACELTSLKDFSVFQNITDIYIVSGGSVDYSNITLNANQKLHVGNGGKLTHSLLESEFTLTYPQNVVIEMGGIYRVNLSDLTGVYQGILGQQERGSNASKLIWSLLAQNTFYASLIPSAFSTINVPNNFILYSIATVVDPVKSIGYSTDASNKTIVLNGGSIQNFIFTATTTLVLMGKDWSGVTGATFDPNTTITIKKAFSPGGAVMPTASYIIDSGVTQDLSFIPSGSNLTVNAGSVATVPSGSTLSIQNGRSLTVLGKLDVLSGATLNLDAASVLSGKANITLKKGSTLVTNTTDFGLLSGIVFEQGSTLKTTEQVTTGTWPDHCTWFPQRLLHYSGPSSGWKEFSIPANKILKIDNTNKKPSSFNAYVVNGILDILDLSDSVNGKARITVKENGILRCKGDTPPAGDELTFNVNSIFETYTNITNPLKLSEQGNSYAFSNNVKWHIAGRQIYVPGMYAFKVLSGGTLFSLCQTDSAGNNINLKSMTDNMDEGATLATYHPISHDFSIRPTRGHKLTWEVYANVDGSGVLNTDVDLRGITVKVKKGLQLLIDILAFYKNTTFLNYPAVSWYLGFKQSGSIPSADVDQTLGKTINNYYVLDAFYAFMLGQDYKTPLATYANYLQPIVVTFWPAFVALTGDSNVIGTATAQQGQLKAADPLQQTALNIVSNQTTVVDDDTVIDTSGGGSFLVKGRLKSYLTRFKRGGILSQYLARGSTFIFKKPFNDNFLSVGAIPDGVHMLLDMQDHSHQQTTSSLLLTREKEVDFKLINGSLLATIFAPCYIDDFVSVSGTGQILIQPGAFAYIMGNVNDVWVNNNGFLLESTYGSKSVKLSNIHGTNTNTIILKNNNPNFDPDHNDYLVQFGSAKYTNDGTIVVDQGAALTALQGNSGTITVKAHAKISSGLSGGTIKIETNGLVEAAADAFVSTYTYDKLSIFRRRMQDLSDAETPTVPVFGQPPQYIAEVVRNFNVAGLASSIMLELLSSKWSEMPEFITSQKMNLNNCPAKFIGNVIKYPQGANNIYFNTAQSQIAFFDCSLIAPNSIVNFSPSVTKVFFSNCDVNVKDFASRPGLQLIFSQSRFYGPPPTVTIYIRDGVDFFGDKSNPLARTLHTSTLQQYRGAIPEKGQTSSSADETTRKIQSYFESITTSSASSGNRIGLSNIYVECNNGGTGIFAESRLEIDDDVIMTGNYSGTGAVSMTSNSLLHVATAANDQGVKVGCSFNRRSLILDQPGHMTLLCTDDDIKTSYSRYKTNTGPLKKYGRKVFNKSVTPLNTENHFIYVTNKMRGSFSYYKLLFDAPAQVSLHPPGLEQYPHRTAVTGSTQPFYLVPIASNFSSSTISPGAVLSFEWCNDQ